MLFLDALLLRFTEKIRKKLRFRITLELPHEVRPSYGMMPYKVGRRTRESWTAKWKISSFCLASDYHVINVLLLGHLAYVIQTFCALPRLYNYFRCVN